MAAFALFPTAIGVCGIVWRERGISGALLPERSETATRARLRRRSPEAVEAVPDAAVASATVKIAALLGGEPVDLSDLAVDLDGVPDFARRVYAVARTIAPGMTLTYGEVARRVGAPGAAREVGAALGRNPIPIVIPCHRVIAAGERSGGFSAPGGAATKLRMLAIEGVALGRQPDLFALPA